MTEAAEYYAHKEQYMDIEQPEPVEEKLGRAADKLMDAIKAVRTHITVLGIQADRDGVDVHCNSDEFFKIFGTDVDYQPFNSKEYPHEYFVTYSGIKVFCITKDARHGQI